MKKLLLLLFFAPLLLQGQDFYWHRTTLGISVTPEITSIVNNNLEDRFAFVDAGPAFSVGPRLQVPLSEHFFFRSGISLAQRNFTVRGGFPFSFNDIVGIDLPTVIGPPIRIDPQSSFFPIFQEQITPASIRLTSMDFSSSIGYMIPGRKVNWYFTSGLRYHLYIAQRKEEGLQFNDDPLVNPPTVTRNTEVDFSNNTWSIEMGAGMAIRLGQYISFFAETNFLYNLNRTRIDEFAFEKYSGLNLSTGINFALY